MLNIPSSSKFSLIIFIFVSNSLFSTFSSAEPSKKMESNLHKGVFLVASEKLSSSPMGKIVIYITQHDHAGTTGFIVNRPTQLKINKAFPKTNASNSTNNMLYFGGPLHTTFLFLITQTQFSHGLHPIINDIYFGAGEQVTMRLRSDNKRDKIRTYAGFMNWGPEQLDEEINKGDWILTPAPLEQLFSQDTSTLWQSLYKQWGGSWI